MQIANNVRHHNTVQDIIRIKSITYVTQEFSQILRLSLSALTILMMTIDPFMVKPLTHIVDIPEKKGEEKGEETACWRNFRDGPSLQTIYLLLTLCYI